MIDLRLGDCLEVMRTLPDGCVQTCVTSPPYFGLRDYGVEGQIGLESTPDAYVARMVEVFREVRRVLRDDGTLWLILGDSFNSSPSNQQSGTSPGPYGEGVFRNQGRRKREVPVLKPKDLIGIPWRVAFALQADGWYLRSDIIWHKPNPMPESVRDRPAKAHEYLFLLSKAERYHYDADAIKEPLREPGRKGIRFGGIKYSPEISRIYSNKYYDASTLSGRNRRTVWTVPTRPYKGAHFATFPPKLIEPCILAGCPAGGTVLDPFSGAGTTGVVAVTHGRKYLGIELNPEYLAMARERIGITLPVVA